MADTKEIEVLVGKESTEAVDASKKTKSSPTIPKEGTGSEVQGRMHYWRRMVCWNCDEVSRVWYDTEAYHVYTCCWCGADNRF